MKAKITFPNGAVVEVEDATPAEIKLLADWQPPIGTWQGGIRWTGALAWNPHPFAANACAGGGIPMGVKTWRGTIYPAAAACAAAAPTWWTVQQ